MKELILTVIKSLYKVGVTVRSLTADGCSLNLIILKLLGCDFSDTQHIISSFKNLCNTNINIHCILNPSHMIKLARNAFGESKLHSKDGQPIQFSLFKKLYELQERLQFKF